MTWAVASRAALVAAMVVIPGPAVAASEGAVEYRCEDGTRFQATFDNSADSLMLDFGGGFRVVLDSAVAGSGMRYVGGGYEFHGKADWAMVRRPGERELECRVDDAAAAPDGLGPSFACRGRLNATEQRICESPGLAELDRTMADRYQRLKERVSQERQKILARDQRRWLARRDRCDGDERCIEEALKERIAALERVLPIDPPAAPPGDVAFPFPARSWGGIVRAGPGQHYSKVASLREGEPITVLAQMEAIFQDRPWFRIRFRGQVGYHWGGLICPVGRAVPGTFRVCD